LKKTRRTKDQEYFIILRKLALVEELKRGDFEFPKVKGKAISQSLDPIVPHDSYVPHSSLIDRLTELKEIESIDVFDSGLRSKKNLPILEYAITSLGMIKLFQLCKETDLLSDVWTNMSRLPYLLMYRRTLKNYFKKKQLFDTLVTVCKNIKIEIDNEPQKFTPGKFYMGVTVSDLLEGKKGIKVYYVFLTVKHNNFVSTVFKRYPVYAKKDHKGRIRFMIAPAYVGINKFVTCAFFHELILRCSNIDFADKGYPLEGKVVVMEILRRDKDLGATYLDFLQTIEWQRNREKKLLDEIKTKISRKRSLLSSGKRHSK